MPLTSHEPPSATTHESSRPLTDAEVAARLGLKVATLRAWRHHGKGPAFVRLGRAVRYLDADVNAFLAANRHGTGAGAAG